MLEKLFLNPVAAEFAILFDTTAISRVAASKPVLITDNIIIPSATVYTKFVPTIFEKLILIFT